jgi:hypothetical protein
MEKAMASEAGERAGLYGAVHRPFRAHGSFSSFPDIFHRETNSAPKPPSVFLRPGGGMAAGP